MSISAIVKTTAVMVVAAVSFTSAASADNPNERSREQTSVPAKLVQVPGSFIRQKVKVKRIGTTTFGNVRVIDRHELDIAGPHTSAAAIAINDPSVRVIGH